MNLAEDVDLEDFVSRSEKLSAADISSICQEAGLQAVRNNRYVVTTKDLETAYGKVMKKDASSHAFYS